MDLQSAAGLDKLGLQEQEALAVQRQNALSKVCLVVTITKVHGQIPSEI